MKNQCKLKMIPLHAVFAFVMICTSGCGIGSGKHIIGQPLREAQSARIKRGETTKQQILEWFGPPVAIARKAATMTFPPPGPRKVGYEELQSEIFFELFSAKNEITEDHIIYYYYSSEIKESFFVLIVGGGTDTKILAVNKLWVLINKKTGIAENYLFREEK